jgi:hypothetical protein
MSFTAVLARCKKSWLPRWFFVAFAIGYTLLFMHLSGGGITHLYSRSTYHRLQAEAMVNGHFGLADSIYQLKFDTAWYNGQVQQIWGLGVGLWLMPFEVLRRWFGLEALPDRAALGIAVFLYALYAGFTALRLGRDMKSKTLGIGLCFLLLFFPPFWILALAPQAVYEETILYACLGDQMLLVALMRFALYRRKPDFLLCCLVSGWLGLVRPTHLIYGLMATMLASILMLRPARRLRPGTPRRLRPKNSWNWKWAVIGILCFASGVFFLALSNKVRFGAPKEFGHTLSATAMPTLFFSRFNQPYSLRDRIPLAKELVGWIFLPALKQSRPWNDEGLVHFQSSLSRWRDIYFPTLHQGYLVALLIGLGGGSVLLVRRLRARGIGCFLNQGLSRLTLVLFVWGLVSMLSLSNFYTHTTSMSSRYVMDFCPALLATVLLAGAMCHRRWPRTTLLAVIILVAADLSRVRQVPILNQSTEVPYVISLAPSMGSTIDEYGGSYDKDSHPAETEMWFNGFGWGKNGLAGPCVMVAVDAPQFLELTLGPRIKSKDVSDIYRARIGATELPQPSISQVNGEVHIRFEVPEAIRRRAGEELVFLCFAKTVLRPDLNSTRYLHAVRWR